jgi:asparagine synthase (glutamine-hydrolysing)
MPRKPTAAHFTTEEPTLMTGYGSDILFEIYPHYLADLLKCGRLVTAWNEAGRWSAAMNSSRWVILRDFGYGKFGWYRRFGGGDSGLVSNPDVAVPPWIRPEFDRQHDLSGRMVSRARRTNAGAGDALRSLTLTALACQAGDAFSWAVATPLGIHVTHPFQDPRLVRLGLGIQDRIRPEPGKIKPVLATAMADILPPEILTRRSKGCFDELYYRGLARNL